MNYSVKSSCRSLYPLILPHIDSLFSQNRSYHAATVMEDDTIIVVGGFDSSAHTGEIVKSKFTLAVMADTYCKIYKTLKHIANGD